MFITSLENRSTLSADYQYGYDFGKNIQEIYYDSHEYFTSSLDYVFFGKSDAPKNVSIGFDVVSGEDSTKNFQRQTY